MGPSGCGRTSMDGRRWAVGKAGADGILQHITFPAHLHEVRTGNKG